MGGNDGEGADGQRMMGMCWGWGEGDGEEREMGRGVVGKE